MNAPTYAKAATLLLRKGITTFSPAFRLPMVIFVLVSIIVGLFMLGILLPTHHDVPFLR